MSPAVGPIVQVVNTLTIPLHVDCLDYQNNSLVQQSHTRIMLYHTLFSDYVYFKEKKMSNLGQTKNTIVSGLRARHFKTSASIFVFVKKILFF